MLKTLAMTAALAALCAPPTVAEPVADKTKIGIEIEGTRLTALSFNRNGEIVEVEVDPRAPGLGALVWIPPRLQSKLENFVNDVRKQVGVQIVVNPHSK